MARQRVPTGANGSQRTSVIPPASRPLARQRAPTDANESQRTCIITPAFRPLARQRLPTGANRRQRTARACIIHPTYRSLVTDGCQRAPVNRKKRSLSTSQLVRWHPFFRGRLRPARAAAHTRVRVRAGPRFVSHTLLAQAEIRLAFGVRTTALFSTRAYAARCRATAGYLPDTPTPNPWVD